MGGTYTLMNQPYLFEMHFILDLCACAQAVNVFSNLHQSLTTFTSSLHPVILLLIEKYIITFRLVQQEVNDLGNN